MAQFPGQASPTSSDAGGDTITIKDNGDGSWTVSVSGDTDSAPDAGDGPQTVQSVDEVLALVKQELGEPDDSQGAWDQEASGRDSTGQRVPPGGGTPSMSM